MNPPTFITFTGLDEATDLGAFAQLARHWPIEAAFLFSPKRQGLDPRYPGWGWLIRATSELHERGAGKLRLAAHLCGDYSRLLVDQKPLPVDLDAMLTTHFTRVQVNGAPAHTADHLANWGAERKVSIVLQAPQVFPSHPKVSFLLDGSSGRGVSPAAWPAPPDPNAWVGYAGGLNSSNVGSAVRAIGPMAAYYWLDMETGVRSNGAFSVEKCRDVCRTVYGAES